MAFLANNNMGPPTYASVYWCVVDPLRVCLMLSCTPARMDDNAGSSDIGDEPYSVPAVQGAGHPLRAPKGEDARALPACEAASVP